jgi:UDP-glucose:(heptosyl)LPS alpha-1,3-glucosyltransferase
MKTVADLRPSVVRQLNAFLGTAAERYCMTKPSTRAVIALSEQVRRDVERYYGVHPGRICVVPHGVDAERFHPRNQNRWRDRTRARLGFGAEEFIVAFIGGDYRRKGLLTLLDAAGFVRAPIRVLAVGVRPNAELARFAPGRVTFVDPTPDVTPYYAAADCFALPTRYDTFSLATLEAMASGLPAIVSREAGVSEYLTDGVDALLLANPDDVDGLAGHLGRLATDHDWRAQLGCGARATAERFTWDRVVDQTLAVYQRVLDERR